MNIRKLILALAATASVGFVACNESNTAQATQNAATVTQAVVATNVSAAVQGTEINAPYAEFLSKYVKRGNGINLVAYDKVTDADRAALRTYIATLEALKPSQMSKNEELAYWFNLYNAKTVDLIVEEYPIKSIKQIGLNGPWGKKVLNVEGKRMSLNDIEHGTVRAKYDEPRIHYAFNCASIGCPDLKPSPWEAATLEADMTEAARDFVASDRGVQVKDGQIRASKIFNWYKKDFGGNAQGILSHVRQYATGDKKAALDAAKTIKGYDYDWNLNIVK